MEYQDIVSSMTKALVLQKWNEGDKAHRSGHPFVWVDAGLTPDSHQWGELSALKTQFTMFYEPYPTPDAVTTDDYDAVLKDLRATLRRVFDLYFPWIPDDEYDHYLNTLAERRTQDYGYIRNFSDLGTSGIKHLTLDPGWAAMQCTLAMRSIRCTAAWRRFRSRTRYSGIS
jgi:hypothetical protein